MSRAVVLSNGEISDPALMRQRLADWDNALVIAADGGAALADQLGLTINAVIGDLDSLTSHQREKLEAAGAHFEVAPSAKDETDLELALLYARQQNAGEVVVVGMLGGRLDMTLSNLLLLTHPDLQSIRIEVWHINQTAWLIRPPGDLIKGKPGDTLSLIPLGGEASGITTHNLVYPLNDESLTFGPARGVSNVLTDDTAHIDLQAGVLLAVHTPGRA